MGVSACILASESATCFASSKGEAQLFAPDKGAIDHSSSDHEFDGDSGAGCHISGSGSSSHKYLGWRGLRTQIGLSCSDIVTTAADLGSDNGNRW